MGKHNDNFERANEDMDKANDALDDGNIAGAVFYAGKGMVLRKRIGNFT